MNAFPQPFGIVPFGAVVHRFLVPTYALVYLQHVAQSPLEHLLVKYRIVVLFVILRLSVPVLLVCLAPRFQLLIVCLVVLFQLILVCLVFV